MNPVTATDHPVSAWAEAFRHAAPTTRFSLIARLVDGSDRPAIMLNGDSDDQLQWTLATTRQMHPDLAVAIDTALAAWFTARRKDKWTDLHVDPETYAARLMDAFNVVQRLDLPISTAELHTHINDFRQWLGELEDRVHNAPLAAYYTTLACTQTQRTLLPLWRRICEQETADTLHLRAALTGLSRLPMNSPVDQTKHTLPGVAVLGFAVWAKKLRATDDDHAAFERAWFFLTLADRHATARHARRINGLMRRYADKPFVAWWTHLLD